MRTHSTTCTTSRRKCTRSCACWEKDYLDLYQQQLDMGLLEMNNGCQYNAPAATATPTTCPTSSPAKS